MFGFINIKGWGLPEGAIRRFKRCGPVVAVSPDDRAIVTSTNGQLCVWDPETGRRLLRLAGSQGTIQSVAFSHDSKVIITGSADGTVRVWDRQNAIEIRCFEGHTKSVMSVALSPDSRYALSGSWDETARLWDMGDGREIHRLNHKLHRFGFVGSRSDMVNCVTFSPDGRRVVTGSQCVRVWDITNGEEVDSLIHDTKYGDEINDLCLSPNGQVCFSGDSSGYVWMDDMESGRTIREIKTWIFEPRLSWSSLGILAIRSLALSADGRLLVIGSENGFCLLARLLPFPFGVLLWGAFVVRW